MEVCATFSFHKESDGESYSFMGDDIAWGLYTSLLVMWYVKYLDLDVHLCGMSGIGSKVKTNCYDVVVQDFCLGVTVTVADTFF